MKRNQTVPNFLQLVFGFLFSVVMMVWAVSAQTQSPERGFNPGKSYAISDIESISMQSGNLSMNMPLASLPPSRGGMSAGLSLHYNSKLYDILTQSFAPEDPKFLQTLTGSKEGGWGYNYKYYLDLEERVPGLCEDVDPWLYYFRRLHIVLPDGSKHVLHLKDKTQSNGFMELDPDGDKICSYATSTAITTGPIVYFTTDGTYLRLELELDADEDRENNAWTLYTADGSTIHRYAPPATPNPATNYIVQRVTDKNGNYIDYIETEEDASYDNHQTVYIKDQLDRKIVLEYEAATNEDQIHAKGVANADIVTRVTWRTATTNKTYHGCEMYPPADNCSDRSLSRSFKVVDKIYLPQQIESGSMFYEFDYNTDGGGNPTSGWGELSKVTLPSKAEAAYEYLRDGVNSLSVSDILKNRPTEKNLTYNKEYDGSTSSVTDTWTYTRTIHSMCVADCVATASITAPNGAVTTEYYIEDSSWSFPQPAYVASETWKIINPDGSVIERLYQSDAPLITSVGEPSDPITPGDLSAANRYVKYEFMTVAGSTGSPSKTAIKEYSQDKNGNTTQVKEYDFVSYSSIPRDGDGRPTGLPSGMSSYLKRITNTEFYNPTPDAASTTYNDPESYHLASSPRLLRLPQSVEVQDAGNNPKSRSEFNYDHESYSSNTNGGNLIETKVWDSFKGGQTRAYSNPLTSTNSIKTSATYNDYGMPLTTTDANERVTQITYGNVTCPGGTVSNLYPTQTVIAYGTSIARTFTSVYDCYTGLTTSTTDVDNSLTNATEYDDLGRPIKAIVANGDATWESWTITEYHDADRFVVVKSDLETKEDGKKVATQFYDQLGRVRLSKTLEDAATQSATNETDGIKVQTRYKTVSGYTYQLSSNPYRASVSTSETDPTMGWTLSTAWSSGIRSEVQSFTGAGLPTAFGGSNTTSTGIVRTDIDANATTVTDQAGKVRRSVTNSLGQLERVDEPTSSGLGTVSSPNQPTAYTYDTLNNLLTVTQAGSGTEQCGPAGGSCSQTRTFSYSSLSRLLTAANPESGTITYGYDPNGNLTLKTDARGVKTDYIYDALNRVTNRNYSLTGSTPPNYQATPNVSYFYDNLANAKGKLIKVTNGTGADRSTTEYTAFDILGRVTGHKQTTDGGASGGYTTSYSYKLSGALDEETYPSGRVVKNVLETDGDLSIVQSKKNAASGYWNYADSFTYSAAGAVTSMQLGNGRWESTVFNSRLQPTQIALGTVQGGTDKLDLDYTYGTTANNGNVFSQQITVPTVGSSPGFVATQNYSYDSLNRLKSATENIAGQTPPSWKQTFTFDRYGNRRFDFTGGNTTVPVSGCTEAICNPTISTSDNRLTSSGYNYDSSGNTTYDAALRKFNYDAENKQTKVESTNSSQVVTGTVGEYSYDGDGKRVKKYVPGTGETTIFVYDAAGKQIAEYSTIVASTENAEVAYLTSDHLGSPRINTDAGGNVTARHDYLPFGEEIMPSLTSQRSGAGYTDDTIRKKFTGYERDGETGLDFAQARMYANSLGRFSTTDPFSINLDRQFSEDEDEGNERFHEYISQAQHWNCYGYTLNNPLRYTDPTGYLEYETTLLGKTIKVSISDNLSKSEQERLKKRIDAGIELINKNASNISEADQNIIRNVTGIAIMPVGEGGRQRSGINTKTGLFTITTPDLDDLNGEQKDNEWAAAIIIHDSFHPDQHKRKLLFDAGAEGREREREANAFAARITKSMGFSTHTTEYLDELSKDPGTRFQEPFKKVPRSGEPCARP